MSEHRTDAEASLIAEQRAPGYHCYFSANRLYSHLFGREWKLTNSTWLGLDVGTTNFTLGFDFGSNAWLAGRMPSGFSSGILIATDPLMETALLYSTGDKDLGDPSWTKDFPRIEPILVKSNVEELGLTNRVDQALVVAPDLVEQSTILNAAARMIKPEAGILTVVLSPANLMSYDMLGDEFSVKRAEIFCKIFG